MKKLNLIQLIVTLLCFTAPFLSLCQGFNTYNYTTNDGLPSSQVYDLIQDENGILWFATDRGLANFNGYEFRSFGIEDGVTDNVIFHFFPQEDGKVWCSTLNKKLFYFNLDGEFYEYSFNKALESVPDNLVISDIQFDNGNLYMNFFNSIGYIKIDPLGELTEYFWEVDNEVMVLSKTFGSDQFIFYEPVEKRKELVNQEKNWIHFKGELEGLKSEKIETTTIFCDREEVYLFRDTLKILDEGKFPIGLGKYDSKHFWVSYRFGGVKVFDVHGNLVNWWLREESITAIMTDHEKGLWLTSLDNGVFYAKNPTLKNYRIEKQKDNYVNSLTRDGENNLYVGLYNGNVYRVTETEVVKIHESDSKEQPQPAIVQYYQAQNKVLISSSHKAFFYEPGEKNKLIYTGYCISLADDISDSVGMGFHDGFAFQSDRLRIMEDLGRTLDLELTDFGALYTSINGIKSHYISPDEQKKSFPEIHFRVDDIDYANGYYYAASMGNGLIIFNEEEYYQIGEKEGLYSNIVSEVLVEDSRNIWVCTNKGVNHIELGENNRLEITGISNADGLVNNEITDIEIIEDVVWIGTRNGVASFDKSAFEDLRMKERDYYLSVKQISVNNREALREQLLDLSHDQNDLEFHVQAISFKYGNTLTYRYKLDDLESSWKYSQNRIIRYPSVPPGNYTFKLQVKGQNGTWEENQITFPVFIRPPFYTTIWFYGIVVLLMVVLIYFFFKVKILTYNRDIIRELLRQILKRLKKKTTFVVFKEQGKDIRIDSSDILYVKAAGNYLEVFTESNHYVIRCKIGEFLKMVPDPLEYLRVHRSYIIRLDKVGEKSGKGLLINQIEIPIGETYRKNLKKILF